MCWWFGGHCTWRTQTPTYVTSVFCERAVPGQSNQGSSGRYKLEQTRPRAARQQNTETRMGKAGWFWAKCFIKTITINRDFWHHFPSSCFSSLFFILFYYFFKFTFFMVSFPISRFWQTKNWIKIFHHSFIHVPNRYLLGASSVRSTALGTGEIGMHPVFMEQAVSLP